MTTWTRARRTGTLLLIAVALGGCTPGPRPQDPASVTPSPSDSPAAEPDPEGAPLPLYMMAPAETELLVWASRRVFEEPVFARHLVGLEAAFGESLAAEIRTACGVVPAQELDELLYGRLGPGPDSRILAFRAPSPAKSAACLAQVARLRAWFAPLDTHAPADRQFVATTEGNVVLLGQRATVELAQDAWTRSPRPPAFLRGALSSGRELVAFHYLRALPAQPDSLFALESAGAGLALRAALDYQSAHSAEAAVEQFKKERRSSLPAAERKSVKTAQRDYLEHVQTRTHGRTAVHVFAEGGKLDRQRFLRSVTYLVDRALGRYYRRAPGADDP